MAPSDRTRFAPNSAAARDIAYYLHPFTNPKVHEENGPFIPNGSGGLDANPYAWNRVANVLVGLFLALLRSFSALSPFSLRGSSDCGGGGRSFGQWYTDRWQRRQSQQR